MRTPVNAGKRKAMHGHTPETLPLGKHKANESVRMRVHF